MNERILNRFLALNYPVKVSWLEEDSLFVAEFLDLPGCSAYGKTVEEAYQEAQTAKKEWLRLTIEQGIPIPTPSKSYEHSGRVLLRLPTSLHSLLADRASTRGTSLNQYMVHLLSAGVVNDSLERQLDDLASQIRELKFQISRLVARTSAVLSELNLTKIQVNTGMARVYGIPTRSVIVSNVLNEEGAVGRIERSITDVADYTIASRVPETFQ